MKFLNNIWISFILLLIIATISCDSEIERNQKYFRLKEPRIAPLAESQWSQEQIKLLAPRKREDGSVINVFKTLVRHPKLFDRFVKFNSVLYEKSLSDRDREILILRICWLCQAKYPFGRHTLESKEFGLTDEEILRITKGPDELGWSISEATLITAADELYNDSIISDKTWETLSEHYTEEQIMYVIFTVGSYNLISWALNSLGVQIDEGAPGFPVELNK